MISRFFIDRPIFAAVLSIVITLAGAVAVFRLPLAQFPKISPPQVSVSCTYPGASARDVAEAVAAPIEQQVNGVEGMMYMSSSCTNDGGYSLSVTFHQYVDVDMAQVLVQNRVALAMPALPDVIKETGVTVRKRSPDPLCGYVLVSPGGTRDGLYLSNYTLRFVREELLRVPGVSDINMIGQRDYSMRIWVNPYRLAARGLTANEVVRAIREQNTQVAAGMIGQAPAPNGQGFQITVDALGRLTEVEEFEQIIVKAMPDGRVVRLRDVARIELGARSADVERRFNGMDCSFMVIFQQPDANALDTRDRIEAKMQELSKSFPDDIEYAVGFDTTPYTRESIKEVFKTLRDAVILVAVVVLLFLQNWRSALIPLLAVPVAIVGTFAVMALLGFSLNNLTLFGLVLAIGIVVDDAIVVVEAVEHHIEHGLSPREATIKAMEQVSGPVVAVGLVLSAVFVPCAFISGITGMFFRQFAVTIAVSTLISAFNSLTLSPALAALLLRPNAEAKRTSPLPRIAFPIAGAWIAWEFGPHLLHGAGWLVKWLWERSPNWLTDSLSFTILFVEKYTAGLNGWLQANWPEWGTPVLTVAVGVLLGFLASKALNRLLAGFFRLFNAGFGLASTVYTRTTGLLLRGSVVVLLLYVGLLGLTYQMFGRTPKGFIPGQDMGYLLISVQLPDSASKERTDAVLKDLEKIGMTTPGIIRVTAISGQSFALNAFGSNFGSMFIGLDDYANRQTPELSSEAVAASLRRQFGEKIFDAQVSVFAPPPIRGVGRAGGFAFVLQDRGDLGPEALQEQVDNLARRGNTLLFNPDGTRATKEQIEKAELRVREAKAKLEEVLAESPRSAERIQQAKSDVAEAERLRPSPRLVGLFSVFRSNVPQLKIVPDPDQCLKRGVPLKDFSDTLRIYQGSAYVNDFNLFGRTWQVIVQSDSQYRDEPTDLKRLKVRNLHDQMVPLGSLADVREVNGPLVLTRYNMYPAATINGTAAPGFSSRQAIDLMQELAEEELPAAMAYEWTDLSYLELKAGNTAYVLFAFAVAMVFLVLAGQYESWSLPLAVILVVPMCLLSSVVGVNVAAMDINIFTQIGFVVLVGLASKNAILIVEFARSQRKAGVDRRTATLEACRLRLRPIVMTSLAFILGVVPLVLAHGAGMEMRRTLGVAVFSGMLGVTLFGLALTPVFFATIDWLGEWRVFRTGLLRKVSDGLLQALTLGPVRRMASRAIRHSNGFAAKPTSPVRTAADEHIQTTAPQRKGNEA